MNLTVLLIAFISILTLTNTCFADQNSDTLRENLGRQLYFDKNLSLKRTQSCASCHDPVKGFVDATDNASERAASLGDDGSSLGDRSAPTSSYANQIPPFHQNKKGQYIGGQFWDGRASSLKEQAAGPPLNPGEMALPNKIVATERLQENPAYVESFKQLYGQLIFADAEAAFDAMTDAIAAFEKTGFFSPFDSKYDRYLRDEYTLSKQEELGKTLFFSKQFSNCNQCHQLKKRPMAEGETFSDYSYHNIGVPVNTALRSLNGLAQNYVDEGLLANPNVEQQSERGKFKVPTLRNVAVTAPYMRNGVFQELRTVVLFYNKYNSKNEKRHINPETGNHWAAPEISENLSLTELESGPALDDKRIDALVAFMKLLTDSRFEYLVKWY